MSQVRFLFLLRVGHLQVHFGFVSWTAGGNRCLECVWYCDSGGDSKCFLLVWYCDSGGDSKCFLLKNASKLKKNYFFKIIFDISSSKRSENIKKFILNKKIQNLRERDLYRASKHTLSVWLANDGFLSFSNAWMPYVHSFFLFFGLCSFLFFLLDYVHSFGSRFMLFKGLYLCRLPYAMVKFLKTKSCLHF